MTSNMNGRTPSRHAHHNTARLEDTHTRHHRAVASFATARRELQRIVDHAVAAGTEARELANMPAFRAHLARASAFGSELQLTTALLRLA
jgi:hypothetical protein